MGYYNDKAISQSQLTNLASGPKYFKNKLEYKVESDALTLGSVVDVMLTEPDNFHTIFVVNEYTKPVGQLGEYIDLIFKGLSEEEAYKEAGFKQKKLEVVKELFRGEDCQKYYNFLLESKDKKVISKEEYDKANRIVTSLLTNRFTSKYFNCDDTECLTQLELYWKYKDFDCRSRLDIVKINHNDKTILPIDVKTSGKSTYNFLESVVRFRYDLQASFYVEALNWYVKNTDKYKGYTVLPFLFIVEHTDYPGLPLIYECTEQDIYCGKYGGTTKTGVTLKGFDQLIEDLKWYYYHDSWDYTREVIENKGMVKMNLFNDQNKNTME